MRFGVQKITAICESGAISHYEIDLVDYQLNSDWQSSITLRVNKKDGRFYHLGQQFLLVRDKQAENDYTNDSIKYHEENHDYLLESLVAEEARNE